MGLKNTVVGFLNKKPRTEYMQNAVSKHTLTKSKEINEKISELSIDRIMIHVQCRHSMLNFSTIVLSTDYKAQTFTIDLPMDRSITNQVAKTGRLKFSCKFRGIEVKFDAESIRTIHDRKGELLELKLPGSIHWHEKRDFVRTRVPSSHVKSNILVSFLEEGSGFLMRHKFQVFDVSPDGISFINKQVDGDVDFELKTNYFCQINLEEFEPIKCKIMISHIQKKPVTPSKQMQIMGCKIIGLNEKNQSLIQQYAQLIQLKQTH